MARKKAEPKKFYVKRMKQYLKRLSLEDIGRIFYGLQEHVETGVDYPTEFPIENEIALMLYEMQRDVVDDGLQDYKTTCENRSKGRQKQIEQDKQEAELLEAEPEEKTAPEAPTPTQERFIPPTREEVEQYKREKGYISNVDAFISHYRASGWKRNGQPITDWKALFNSWERKEPQFQKLQQAREAPRSTNFSNYEGQRDIDYDSLEKRLLGY